MIGKHQLIIDASDFVKGMSSSADIADGGFSNETTAVNLTANLGVLYAPATPTDKSTNLTGSAIAYTPCSSATSVNGFILAGDGKIMSISSTQVLTASSALAGTYTTGKSDIANFNGVLFATSTTDVARMNTDLTAGDATWWSVTATGTGAPFGILTSGVPHPLLEFIGYLWVGNLNSLHRIDSSVAGVENAFSLDSSWTIVALGVDISTGTMLISATRDSNSGNYSNTLATGSAVFVFDGVSSTFSRQIHVDAMITGFRNVGGVTYLSYGQKLGYWNGNGITFLRKFKNVTLAGTELAYKHHMTNIENTLYVIDGKQVLAFGEILPGQKKFYYAQDNTINSNKYSLICPAGDNLLGLGFATTKFYTFDVGGTSTADSISFYTNKYMFPRPVFLRSVRLEYGENGVANNGSVGDLKYLSSEEAASFTSLSTTVNTSGGTVYFTNNLIGFVLNKVYWVQLQISTYTQLRRLRRIILYYDVAE